jgi:hypothetical protein
VLAVVLMVNMVLLVPHIHVHGPSTTSSGSSRDTSWVSAPPPGPSTSGGSRQQRGVKAPQSDLWHDFDSNDDGVLGPAEFQALLQV